jgi:biotin operon repressor
MNRLFASLARTGSIVLLALAALVLPLRAQQTNSASEWKPVEDALGRKGSAQPGDVFKFSMPRSDLKVTVAGTPIKAGLALGSWAAFKKVGNGAMVMGDLVLTESEVELVMSKLQQGGIEITAVHNHLLHETPRVMYMHIAGHGDAVKLASALKAALALTKAPASAPTPAAQQQNLGFDTAQIDQALGQKGKNNGGTYQVSVPRAEAITDMETQVPPAMGTATSLNFQPTGGGKAAITGDFVLIASEVNPVIEALRSNGIQVTAVHSHMLTESPRLFFMHFWAGETGARAARRSGQDKFQERVKRPTTQNSHQPEET